MRVRLLTNFRGIETSEVLWKPGEEHEVDETLAAMLVRDRKAKPVNPVAEAVATEIRRRVQKGATATWIVRLRKVLGV